MENTALLGVGITVNHSSPSPPGVTDGIGVALQDLTLNGPLTGVYTPAVHHAQPVQWVRRRVPVVADQFADADK